MEKNQPRKLLNVGKIALCSRNFLAYNPSNLISEATSGTVVLDPLTVCWCHRIQCASYLQRSEVVCFDFSGDSLKHQLKDLPRFHLPESFPKHK